MSFVKETSHTTVIRVERLYEKTVVRIFVFIQYLDRVFV